MAVVASTEKVVLTDDACEEIEVQIDNNLKRCLNDPIFIAKITNQIAEAITKTVSYHVSYGKLLIVSNE
nr:unnamed protein product [Callosobruchus analis]